MTVVPDVGVSSVGIIWELGTITFYYPFGEHILLFPASLELCGFRSFGSQQGNISSKGHSVHLTH